MNELILQGAAVWVIAHITLLAVIRSITAMLATLTYLPFILNTSITTLTALDFLGFGLPLDSPSLGRLLSTAKSNLQAPWIGISVFMTLAVMFFLLIFIGEAIRDALDPRKTMGGPVQG